ncbi:MAG: PD-(D/E)XK nuclease family protein [Chloroflexi bacterium]|nr:PD-(D/E)XK nuclease family protein [Chloroflexota bacterium]
MEAKFGLGGDSWPEATMALGDGVTLRFRGIIDRVDIDAEGKTVVVLDYKTGASSYYNGLRHDPVDRGKKLQLPIYSLAVLGALGAGIDIKAAYWFVTTRGNFTLLPSEAVSFDAVQERFKDAVTTIVSGIGGGLFPANPGKEGRGGGFENCRYCEFDTLCPSRRDVMWEQKKQDSRLAEYVELSGED